MRRPLWFRTEGLSVLAVLALACGDVTQPLAPEWEASYATSMACPLSSVELDLVREINRVRVADGKQELEIDLRLVNSAVLHARHMSDAEMVAQTLPGELTLDERIWMQGYPDPFGEVNAAVLPGVSVQSMVQQWLSVTADRNVLLSASARHAGVSFSAGASLLYWTVDLGSSSEAALSGDCTLTSNQAPSAAFSAPAGAVEGSPVTLDAQGSSDPDGDALSYAWDFGDGTTGSGVTASHTWANNGSYTVTLAVADGNGGESTATQVITVSNAAPVILSLTGPAGEVAQGEVVQITGSFRDPGVSDTHVVTIDWFNKVTTPALVPDGAGGYSFTDTGMYDGTGTRTITVTVTDNDGGSVQGTITVVLKSATKPPVKDVLAFGSGWFHSPEGSVAAKSGMRAKAFFAFSGKRHRGRTWGVAELRVPEARLSLHSTSMDSFEVEDGLVRMSGSGRVNGQRGYAWLVTAREGDRRDFVRIKVWDESTGDVVYDSEAGAPDDASPGTAIMGGRVHVIHLR